MLRLFIVLSLMTASLAYAESVSVLNVDLSRVPGFNDSQTKYLIDKSSNQAQIVLELARTRTVCRGTGSSRNRDRVCTERRSIVYSTSAKVEGLSLEDSALVYRGPHGAVECGVMKPSRVLRIPTLYLNGNCTIRTEIRKNIYSVKFETK